MEQLSQVGVEKCGGARTRGHLLPFTQRSQIQGNMKAASYGPVVLNQEQAGSSRDI